jgi:hypothetical protein
MEDKIPLHADHSTIVKFDTRYAPGYKSALEKLRQFEQDAPRVVAARFCTSIYLFLSNALCCGSDVWSIMSTLAADVALFLAQAQNRPEPLLIVPFQRDSMFVGREDIITEVEKRLKQGASRNHTRVALVGLGGVG